MKSTLIIVGGFLGAGKTSLLWKTANKLAKRGEKIGIITNDQTSELVDTSFLSDNDHLVKEVSGSCFCCNFNGFAEAITSIHQENDGGIILAEPVGSCTDLSATLFQPLKEKYQDIIQLKPLTVLADPDKLSAVLSNPKSFSNYINYKQFEEADIILINKTDLLSADQLQKLTKETQAEFHTKVMSVSVKTGDGFDEWLDTVLNSDCAGKKIAEVDYDIYADGEAAYGWLNSLYTLSNPTHCETLCKELLNNLAEKFEKNEINVGHVKFILQTTDTKYIGNITGDKNTISLRTRKCTYPASTLLTFNARAETSPDILEKITDTEIKNIFSDYHLKETSKKSLIPGRPNPTYRYENVI